MSSRRPTQGDIARAAGVTQSTVSLALSNHPRISTEVRNHVREIARKMGYHPDPYLSGLCSYRNNLRPLKLQATLAWISNYGTEGEQWKDIPTFQHYFSGATQRAAELGYRIEEHRLKLKGMTPRRMVQILKAKNIQGILFAPQPAPLTRLDFDLEPFSSVTFGYSLLSPSLHMVTHHHFRSMETICRKLYERGHRRIGLALERKHDLRVERIVSSVFLREQYQMPLKDRVPMLLSENLTAPVMTDWLRTERPDAIIGDMGDPWWKEAGLAPLGGRPVAFLSVRNPSDPFMGIWENPNVVGARAVELLVEHIHRAERGVPEFPSCLLVDGTWVSA